MKNMKMQECISPKIQQEEKKKIAITFDDGPHPEYTKKLLDGLKERNVKVTFFVTGEQAFLHGNLIQRMVEEGHLVGNHTYSHIQLKENNVEEFLNEVEKTNQILYEIAGVHVEYIRPPYGSWNKNIEEKLNMIPVFWTIDPKDWNQENSLNIIKNVVPKAEENGIILLHDSHESSVEAALYIIDDLKDKGYYFVTADEILFD